MSDSGEEERVLSSPNEVIAEDETEVDEKALKKNTGTPGKLVNTPSKPKKPSTNMTRSKSPAERTVHPDLDPKMPRRLALITEENAVLKRQLRKQEDRIKVLATKLIRIISERSSKTKREEILLEEQKARIADLQHEVSSLRQKLHVSKQQLSSYTKLIPHHPPSRQASVLSSSTATTHSKFQKKPRPTSGSQPPRPSTASSSQSRGNIITDKKFADRVEQLLLEAKAENQALEDQLKHCRKRLEATEEELEKVKASLQSKEVDHQEEILSIKAQLDKEQDMTKRKKQLSDNIQLIRLQRDSRRTASWLTTLETQCKALEAGLSNATDNAQQLDGQLTDTQQLLMEEQQKNVTLQKQVDDAANSLSRLKELEAQISELQNQNKIMNDQNAALLKKAFAGAETRKTEVSESLDTIMRVQISHLESCLKTELATKSELQQGLRIEKEKCVRLEFTNEKLQEIIDKLSEEMKKFKLPEVSHPNNNKGVLEADETCDNSETTHRDSTACTSSTSGVVSRDDKSLSSSRTEKICEHQRRVNELEDELHAQKLELNTLSEEHSRTKGLLKTQVAANRDYQREVEELTGKLDMADEFHHKKLQDFVQVLEERTRQISLLEKRVDEWKAENSAMKEPCTCCDHCAGVKITPATEKSVLVLSQSNAEDTELEKSHLNSDESGDDDAAEDEEDTNAHKDDSLIEL